MVGMYTEFFFRAPLRGDVDRQFFVRLNETPDSFTPVHGLPEHPFFQCERWHNLFCGGSAYHETRGFDLRYDSFRSQHILFCHSSFKNYDGEIEKFLDWIDPMVEELEGTFLGYSLYEEDEQPILYYKKG
jgi:hypothetical protein